VADFKILEVVSGFGLGGAEKALAARMKYLPPEFEHMILNVRPEIDRFNPQVRFAEHKITSGGINRIMEIRKFLISKHFDLVIVRTPLDAIRFGFLKRLIRNQTFKLVFEAHSNFLTTRRGFAFILGSLLRWNSRNIDLVVSVSDNVSKGPLCTGQRCVEKVYLGSDLDFKNTGVVHSDVPHLLFVGRLVDLKRPIWLLERIRNLSRANSLPIPTLTMVGFGPLEVAVREFIRSNDLEGTVRFIGGQDDVLPYFKMATHLVSCSTNEGLPLTFFEAKLSGLAILATPSGGGSEIFGDEDLELTSFDESEFEIALLNILSSTPPSLESRRAIRERSKWMSAEEGSRRYYSLISRLLSS
jgi:glycosyltransferase involved in cell wall biosynthesis